MSKRKFNIRKMVTFDPDIWDQISNFRFQNRIGTETEAIRLLIESGLTVRSAGATASHLAEARKPGSDTRQN